MLIRVNVDDFGFLACFVFVGLLSLQSTVAHTLTNDKGADYKILRSWGSCRYN